MGNTALEVAGADIPGNEVAAITSGTNLLAGATDANGDTLTVQAETLTTTEGGRVTINSDGSFYYIPEAGDNNITDTFTFTVLDTNGGSDTATASITVGDRIWYVDDDAAPGGDGTSANPFSSLAPLDIGGSSDGLDGPGDTIYVLEGTYSNGLTLEDNQSLLGQGVDLVVDGMTLITATNRPVLSTTGGDVITLANNNTLEGFSINGLMMGQDGIAGVGGTGGTINGVLIEQMGRDNIHLENWNGITFNNITSTDATRHSIFLNNTSGTIDFTGNNTITHGKATATGDAFHIDGGNATVNYGGSITNSTNNAVNRLIAIRNTTGGSVAFRGGTLNQTAGDGIFIEDIAGATTIDSTINITGGAGMESQGGTGNVTVNGSTTIANNTGSAITVSDRVGGAVQFGTINLNNSGGQGITLTNNAGSFTANGLTTIDGATGIGVDINGGTGDVSLTGVTVQNRNNVGIDINAGNQAITLGAVTINNQNSATNTALNIQNTTGGSVTATSTTIDNNNAVAEGVVLVNNAAAINLGTGSITGAGNTAFRVTQGLANVDYAGSITNSAGRSVEVTNSGGITANAMINLTGAINDTGQGIFLNNNALNAGATVNLSGGLTLNTGANAAFTATNGGTVNVTGTNTINTTTGTGVNIANTTIGSSNVTFQSVSVTGAANGIVVDNAGITGSLIVTGSTTKPDGGTIRTTAQGVQITNSNASLSRMDISSSGNHGVEILSSLAGTYTVALSNNTIGSTSGGAANDGLNAQTTTVAGATLNLAVNDNMFSSTNGDGADINGSNNGTLNIIGFSGNMVTSTGGNGLSVNTATFDANTVTGGIQQVNAGDTQIGTAGAIGGNGIDFTNVLGDVTFGGGSSIQNTTGTAFNINNGTATITYAGSITNSSGRSVNIQNRTNGGNITLSGAISDTGATQGIGILNNAGTNNFNFTGAVDLGTTANRLTGGTALTFTGNSAGTTASFSDLDIATNDQIGINGTTAGTLNVTTGTLNTTGAGAIGAQLNSITSGMTFSSVTVDAIGAGNNALDFTNLAGTFAVTGNTNIGATGAVGTGININGGTAGYTFGGMTISNSAAAGINVSGTTGGSVGLNSTLNVNGSGTQGINLANNAAGFTVTGATTVDNATGSSINITGAGNATFAGVTVTNRNAGGIDLNNTSGTLQFGATNISGTGGVTAGVDVNGTTGGSVAFNSTLGVSGSGGDGINLSNNNQATFTVTGATTITNATGNGIELNNSAASGTVNFGITTITDAAASGIALNDNLGTVNFAATNINLGATASTSGIRYLGTTNQATNFGITTIGDIGNAASQVGINFNGVTLTGAANYNSVNLSGPNTSTTSIGVDLTALAGNQTVNLGSSASPTTDTPSSITDLHRGVVIDNTAAVQFTFGDGELASDTASSIDVNGQTGALTVDASGGTLGASSFDFEDVMVGSGDIADFPASPTRAVFVSETGGTIAAGTHGLSQAVNTITVAAAEALANTGQTFAFVAHTGVGQIDVTGGGADGFSLLVGQSLDGFDDGNAIAFGDLQPSNVLGNLGAVGGAVTQNSVTAVNTVGGATAIVTGNGGNTIENTVFDGGASPNSLINVVGAGTAVTLNNLELRNTTAGNAAVNLSTNTGNVSLTDVDLIGSHAGTALQIDNAGASTGTVTVDAASDIDSTAGMFTGTVVSVGTGSRNVDLSAVTIDVANNTSPVIDITGQAGGTISVGNVTSAGATGDQAINSTAQTAGSTTFGNVSITDYGNATTDTVVNLQGSGGSVSFTDLDVTTTNGAGVNVGAITFDPGSTSTINATGETALALNATTLSGGGVTFNGVTSNNGTNGVSITNTTGNVAINTVNIGSSTAAGIDISGANGTFTFGATGGTVVNNSATTGAGVSIANTAGDTTTVNFNGGLDIDTTSGIGLNVNGVGGSATTVNVAGTGGTEAINTTMGQAININTAALDITLDSVTSAGSGAEGINIDNATGTFTTSGGSLTTATGTSFDVTGGSAAITYGGTINNAVSRMIAVQNTTGGSVIFNNATANAYVDAGTGILIDGAAGNVTLSNGDLNGSTGIEILGDAANNATGTFTFNDTTIDVTGNALIVNGGAGDDVNATIDLNNFDITNPSARVASITGLSGGSIDFDTNSTIATNTGTGILLDSNAGGSTTFKGNVTLNTGANNALTLTNNTGHTLNLLNTNLNVDTTSGTGFAASGGGTINITGANNNIDSTTGTALNWDGVTIGTSNVTLATLDKNDAMGANVGIRLNNVDNNTFTVGSSTIAGTAGANINGIEITGGSSSAFTFGSATIDNTSGDGINLNGANGAVTLTTVNIDGTTGSAIDITNNSNLINIAGGTIGSTTDAGNAANAAVQITGGANTGNVTVASAITNNTAGEAVQITGRSGGTVTVSGAINHSVNGAIGINVNNNTGGSTTFSSTTQTINSGTAPGVFLTNNPGHTIDFTGGNLNITTMSGTGFNATDGGTVTVQGANNIISSTTGTAVNVANTTIGTVGAGPSTTYGMTFQNISADGGTNGIVLNNAGNGGFQVTGTGSTSGSGGTLQNITNNGVQITNSNNIDLNNMILTGVATANSGTAGSVFGALNAISGYNAGIKLNAADTITLNNLTIDGTETGAGVDNNNGEVGVSGINVSNLTLTDVTVANFGNADGVGDGNEDNIQFQNLTGTVTVNNLTTRDSGGGLFSIQNFAGIGALTLNMSNSTFGDTVMGVGRGGLEVETGATGGTTSVSVTGTTFGTGVTPTTAGALQGTAISMDVNTGATGNLSVQNSTINGANVGVSGTLDIGNGNLTANISNNSTITGIRSTGINFFTNGAGSTGNLSATVQNNTIGTMGSFASGSQVSNGINVSNEGSGTTTVLIDNNTIQEIGDGINGFEGIFIGETVSAGTVNATITNNMFNNIRDDRALQATISSTGTLCSNISGNTFSGIIRGDNPITATTSAIRIRRNSGTHNSTQASQADLATANGLASTNITVTGTVAFGQLTCPVPM